MFDKLTGCCIIAEIGGNFTTYEEAVALIDAAEESGVDCLKLQTFRAETIVTNKGTFDMESTGVISQQEYFRKYEISEALHHKIIKFIESKGIEWFSTPSHPSDLDMLLSLGMKAIKVGSDDANNFPFIKYAAKTQLPIVLSTGMCTLKEVKEAVEVILKEGNNNIIILHTVSGYPTYPEDVNLNVINTYKREFPGFHVGFSDHTLTPLASIAAAAMGAVVIERHFTLNKHAEGPDHRISSTPEEMRYIVDSIRDIERMKGSGEKEPCGPEINNRINNRKSIVTTQSLIRGQTITKENIDIKRPGNGIAPGHYEEIIGRKTSRDIDADIVLSWDDIA